MYSEEKLELEIDKEDTRKKWGSHLYVKR